METQTQAPQPIIVQSASGKRSATDYIFGALFIGGGLWLGNRYLKKWRSDKEAGKLDTPQSQAASRIRTAIEGAGTNEAELFETARFIALNKIAWKDVAASYKNLYAANIEDDLRSDFDAKELKTFFDIFNFTTSSLTTPPPFAALQFDTSKLQVVFLTKKETNIRKSAKVLGGGAIDKADPSYTFHKSNVIRLVPQGKYIGVATGRSAADNNGNLFYEFTSLIADGKAFKAYKLWAAASQLDKKEFKTGKEASDFYTNAIKNKSGVMFSSYEFNKASE